MKQIQAGIGSSDERDEIITHSGRKDRNETRYLRGISSKTFLSTTRKQDHECSIWSSWTNNFNAAIYNNKQIYTSFLFQFFNWFHWLLLSKMTVVVDSQIRVGLCKTCDLFCNRNNFNLLPSLSIPLWILISFLLGFFPFLTPSMGIFLFPLHHHLMLFQSNRWATNGWCNRRNRFPLLRRQRKRRRRSSWRWSTRKQSMNRGRWSPSERRQRNMSTWLPSWRWNRRCSKRLNQFVLQSIQRRWPLWGEWSRSESRRVRNTWSWRRGLGRVSRRWVRRWSL